ncbi:hypothetical protein BDB01DRAFT_799722 [Pilobolus umbonatus]|nr:hypothetical protein BDB01DRAFT_799722 [Pilobolus umbonatus]
MPRPTHHKPPVHYPSPRESRPHEPETKSVSAATVVPTISAEPQLRDLRKELIGFVPTALRRKQAAAKKVASLPKGVRPTINAAPAIDQAEEE